MEKVGYGRDIVFATNSPRAHSIAEYPGLHQAPGNDASAVAMVLERLQQMASHVTGHVATPHPFDPLCADEIARAVGIIKQEHSDVFFNAITIKEPPKAEVMRWLASPDNAPRPGRFADCVCIGPGSKVYDALVDMERNQIIKWE